ncbi:MAG: SAM-dependent methyltransferase [Bacteroidales bacterium]|nr:SAM-dependent methyltransferase [Bacteroidales bacterium]
MQTKNQGCLICGEELSYSIQNTNHKCEICGQIFKSNVQCKNHHFVCDKCHQANAISLIEKYCLNTKSKNPVFIANEIMQYSKVNLHGPEHHFLVPAALFTAYANASSEKINLKAKLNIIKERAKSVLGGFCGFHGACGAAIGSGIFFSVLTQCTPLSEKEWKLSNLLTADALKNIAEKGGPRCCKRDTFTAILTTVKFLKINLNISLENHTPICSFYKKNKECKTTNCDYFPKIS